MGDRIDEFVALVERVSGVEATIDRPEDATGITFIDIKGPGANAHVSFQPSAGFGIFKSDDVFGQRPNKLIEDPSSAAEQILKELNLAARSPLAIEG